MIVVDTNVLSQAVRADGHRGVVHWMDEHAADLWLPTLVVSELLFGAHRLNDAIQRASLLQRMDLLLARFGDRHLPFDLPAARTHARVAGECRRAGAQLNAVDGRIAAIAIEHAAPVATRNVRDFKPTGVRIINPWEM